MLGRSPAMKRQCSPSVMARTWLRSAAAAAWAANPLDLADASFRFQALPRLALAVLLLGRGRGVPGPGILFGTHAGHYLPTEDLSGLGDWLAHRLTRR